MASVLIVGLALLVDVNGSGVTLPEATLSGWNRYVAAIEARRRGESAGRRPFLLMDAGPGRAADRQTIMAGQLLVKKVDDPVPGQRLVEVQDAMVHHWRGAVLLRGATLERLMNRLETAAPPTSPEVLSSAVLERGPARLKVYLRLQRTKIVTAVFNTIHDVTFNRPGTGRAESRSVATHIAEVGDPGTSRERELAFGEDRGFLWKLNAYWRYVEVPGGVIAECESISLSRAVPFGLGMVAGPIIRSTARESMERTLESLRDMAP
jgi:hypothetical protein